MDQRLITRIVEAALLAANQPLALAQLHALFPEDAPAPAGSVEKALETLREACAEVASDTARTHDCNLHFMTPLRPFPPAPRRRATLSFSCLRAGVAAPRY